MDSTIIAATIALSGVALGSILAGLGYYLKTRAERLRYKKQLLLHLLELSNQFRLLSVDISEFTDEYIRICKKVFKKYDIEEADTFSKESYDVVEFLLNHYMNTLNRFDLEEFFSSFENTLKEVSKSDPLLVFELKAQGNIMSLINEQNDFFESLFKNVDFESFLDLERKVKNTVIYEKDAILENGFHELNFYILLVSKKCVFLTWLKCKRIIENNPYKNVDFNLDGTEIEERLVENYKELGVIPKNDTATV